MKLKEVSFVEEFKFKKKFGQNFLQNKAVIDKIAKVVLVKPGSLIIEVGPGSGNLTVALAELHKDSNILAYEIDNNLEDILSVRLNDYNNVKVLFSDFLKADIALDVKEYSYNNIYFVSNVPYYITTPILFKLIDSNLAFEKIVNTKHVFLICPTGLGTSQLLFQRIRHSSPSTVVYEVIDVQKLQDYN